MIEFGQQCNDGQYVKKMQWLERRRYGLVNLRCYCSDGQTFTMTGYKHSEHSSDAWNVALACNNGFSQMISTSFASRGVMDVQVSCFIKPSI